MTANNQIVTLISCDVFSVVIFLYGHVCLQNIKSGNLYELMWLLVSCYTKVKAVSLNQVMSEGAYMLFYLRYSQPVIFAI